MAAWRARSLLFPVMFAAVLAAPHQSLTQEQPAPPPPGDLTAPATPPVPGENGTPDAAAPSGPASDDAKVDGANQAAEPETSEPVQPSETEQNAEDAPAADSAAQTLAIGTGAPEYDMRKAAEHAAVPENNNAGSLTYQIRLDVPAFRGIEPKLALRYDSLRKSRVSGLYQGWFGYGWGLDGLDVIERVGRKQGVPEFQTGAEVNYMLNGEELVPCPSLNASPSCSTGPDYNAAYDVDWQYFATQRESFRRIARTTNNRFQVTDRDGTISIFRSPADLEGVSIPDGTPAANLWKHSRWLLSYVRDTHGNSVEYEYTCTGIHNSPPSSTGVCYPYLIKYKNDGSDTPVITIQFFREDRPDWIRFANGQDISTMASRIKTISVRVGSQLRNAYALTYTQATFSKASLLSRVDLFGNNATVNGSGDITEPTEGFIKRRIGAFSYAGPKGEYINRTNILPHDETHDSKLFMSEDLNFDGMDELGGETETRSGSTTTTERFRFVFSGTNSFTQEELTLNSTGLIPPPDYLYATLARYNSARNVRDIVYARVRRAPVNPELVSIERWVRKTNENDLRAQGVRCADLTGNDFTYYNAACQKLPADQDYGPPPSDFDHTRLALDVDGDGIDRFYEFPRSTYAKVIGAADLRGQRHPATRLCRRRQ